MLRQVRETVWRVVGGSLTAILAMAGVALTGASETVSVLLAERSATSLLFLGVLTLILADLISKLVSILAATFPDVLPKVDRDTLRLASFVDRASPGQGLAVLAGTQGARVGVFLLIFALLGWSYASAPDAAQASLVGAYEVWPATLSFIREAAAGSIGYFLFFLSGERLAPLTEAIAAERLAPVGIEGDVFLSGLRLYGLAFVLAVLRLAATPVIFARARLRAKDMEQGQLGPTLR